MQKTRTRSLTDHCLLIDLMVDVQLIRPANAINRLT